MLIYDQIGECLPRLVVLAGRRLLENSMGDKVNFEIVKTVIAEWDPLDLLDHAPADEYDIESREIFSKLQHSVEQNGMIIYDVFSNAFGMTFSKSVDECICIAKKMMMNEQLRF